MPTLDNILAVILGGGRGSRLYPLTRERSKPAVPMAGKYRLIDVPLSNCINSHIFHVAVLTQFNSVSLHRHISRTYNFDSFHSGWVQIWAAEQTFSSADWYQGTADAVRKQLIEIKSAQAPHTLILAGDHLYRMDYAAMVDFHLQTGADITVAVQPAARKDTVRFGILKRDSDMRITDFAEKPKDPALLEKLISRDDPQRPYLASMGIYLFKSEVLYNFLLDNPEYDDFGGDVIPHAIRTHQVFGYDFDDYWEDIGTIRSFYDTNLALTDTNPPFNFFAPDRPIYTSPLNLPGSTLVDSQLNNVLITEGCHIRETGLRRSVIGPRTQILGGTQIENSIVMGADFYENPATGQETYNGNLALGIGTNCRIEGTIIDKNSRIGSGVTIRSFPRGIDIDQELYTVRDGIVIIPKGTCIPPGTHIGPETPFKF